MQTKAKTGLTILMIISLFAACQANSGQENLSAFPPTSTPQGLNGPLPPFIYHVLVPEPQSVVSLRDYQHGYHYPADAHPAPGGAKNSVCAHVSLDPLLAFGDDADSVHTAVFVDGSPAEAHPEFFMMLGETVKLDEEGNVVASKPSGPLVRCWIAELNPGMHIATIEANKSSGEVLSYSWSFEIVDEQNQ